MFDTSFNFMFSIFPIFFLLIFGLILFTIIRGIKEWNYNNHQPVLSVPAKVVSKRTHVSRHTHAHDNHHHHSSSTTYYVTFEVESGDRMELHVPSREYGMIVEGDEGKLTFQGTRFHSFNRNI
ncbi:DUF2500 domain-containing protein [Brassicibacter mesophilus]|uniref:DUF2500 domain-containing protein n=1 Tax=Brassicibacter mesophilus TaxID=745119 RepID=UPI003D23C927